METLEVVSFYRNDYVWRLGIGSPGYPDGGRFIGELDDIRVYSKALGLEMATQLYNHGLSDHGLTVEPFDFDPVQDPELQEEVSVEVKFKRYGVVSLNEMQIEDLNFFLTQTRRDRRSHALD